jgi:hypothetical protein
MKADLWLVYGFLRADIVIKKSPHETTHAERIMPARF